MNKFKAAWELMRLEHGVMLFLAILIGSIISQKTIYSTVLPPLDKVILTFFTALFLEASTFALNDYYDVELDRINKRTDRPLVRGDIKPKTALLFFYILFPLGLICAFFVNLTCFIIALLTALLSVLYDVKMKKIKLIGNFYIAYIMAIPFVFGGAAVLKNTVSIESIPSVVYIIALIAFLAGSGREIMKDVQDFEGDVVKGVRSFPKYVGKRASNIISAVFFLIAIVLSFIPFLEPTNDIYHLNYAYFFPVLLCDIMLLITAFTLIYQKKPKFKIYRRFTLVAIFIGLIAFLIGAFVNL